MRKPVRIALIGGTAAVIAAGGTAAALTAGSGGSTQPAGATAVSTPVSATSSGPVSADQARQAAQQQLPGATVTKTDLDRDHGRAVWEVDLNRGQRGYEVRIDGTTGKIISVHAEHRDDNGDHNDSGNRAAGASAASGKADGAAVSVSADQARQIAQQKLPGATVTETDLDRDHGRAVWEVDLNGGQRGYEVHVDGSTGKIISVHADSGDHD
jgi:uncharacterized membrane protein YkoI